MTKTFVLAEVDLASLIEENYDEVVQILYEQFFFSMEKEVIERLHRIQEIHGDKAVLDKLKDLYHEFDLYVSYP